MMKLPAGITTISGHVSHSLKLSFGRNALSSAGDNGAARDWACPVTAPDMPANTINAMINAARIVAPPDPMMDQTGNAPTPSLRAAFLLRLQLP